MTNELGACLILAIFLLLIALIYLECKYQQLHKETSKEISFYRQAWQNAYEKLKKEGKIK